MLRTAAFTVAILLSLTTVAKAAAEQPGTDLDALHLPSPTYPDALRIWRGGDPAAALGRLEARLGAADTEPPLEAILLRASLLAGAGRPEAAERVWRDAIERAVWIRTYARRALVDRLAARQQPVEAAPVLADLTRSDPQRHRDLVMRVADAYRETGRTNEAARLYREVIAQRRRDPLADAARLGLAAALEANGDLDAALSLLRETRLLHWRADIYQQATRDERRLGDRLNQTPRPFDEAEYRALGRRLRNASRFQLSRDLIDEWQHAHPLTARPDRLEAERIQTLYAERANEQAVAHAQRFYARYPASVLSPDVRLTEFRLAVRMTDTERARRMGQDLWRGRIPGATARQRRSAAVLLAAYLAAGGDLTESLALYRELFRTSEYADDQRAYLWRAGVAALRDQQDDRALTNLRGLLSRNPNGDLAPAGLYWLGVTELRRDEARAVRTFQAVTARFPYHYYGIRARERLSRLTKEDSELDRAAGIVFPTLALSVTSRDRAEYRAATTLARAGLTADAAWYLRRLLERRRGDSGLALLAARASADAGDHAEVSRIMTNHFGRFLWQPARGLPDDFWRLVYPRPFWNEVQAAAGEVGVDPVLLLSLMRQESRYDPAARSPVGAIGLFQIMPYTATALGRAAGLDGMFEDSVDETALMRPSVNTAIAARLTGNLMARFDGEIAPLLAAYNAGEERVETWWSASRQLGEDVFIDSIPYSETRRFVREVLTNYTAYHRVYADQ